MTGVAGAIYKLGDFEEWAAKMDAGAAAASTTGAVIPATAEVVEPYAASEEAFAGPEAVVGASLHAIATGHWGHAFTAMTQAFLSKAAGIGPKGGFVADQASDPVVEAAYGKCP